MNSSSSTSIRKRIGRKLKDTEQPEYIVDSWNVNGPRTRWDYLTGRWDNWTFQEISFQPGPAAILSFPGKLSEEELKEFEEYLQDPSHMVYLSDTNGDIYV